MLLLNSNITITIRVSIMLLGTLLSLQDYKTSNNTYEFANKYEFNTHMPILIVSGLISVTDKLVSTGQGTKYTLRMHKPVEITVHYTNGYLIYCGDEYLALMDNWVTYRVSTHMYIDPNINEDPFNNFDQHNHLRNHTPENIVTLTRIYKIEQWIRLWHSANRQTAQLAILSKKALSYPLIDNTANSVDTYMTLVGLDETIKQNVNC